MGARHKINSPIDVKHRQRPFNLTLSRSSHRATMHVLLIKAINSVMSQKPDGEAIT